MLFLIFNIKSIRKTDAFFMTNFLRVKSLLIFANRDQTQKCFEKKIKAICPKKGDKKINPS